MASFTMELWEVLELEDDTGDGHKIGLGAYPLPAGWDGTNRDGLNKKIIDHYWNREIGHETVSIFEHRLMRRMNEIMPLYIQLYESAQFKFDPLSTIDITTVRNDDTTENVRRGSTSNATGSTAAKSRAVSSSPPQSQLSGNGQYATGINDTNSTGSSDSTGDSIDTTTGDSRLSGSSTSSGRQGSANRLLAEYRSNILNIDLMVIEDLDELFMGVWDTNDELLPERGTLR